MRYRATLAYDGTAFQGFQRQRDGVPTVQGAVEAALAALCGGGYVVVRGAGRTDTGVHATGQVVAFDLDWTHGSRALYHALNANLPPSVAVTHVSEAADGFHPRFDAVRRAYRYRLLLADHPLPLERHTAWVVLRERCQWALKDAQAAAATLPGTRDFGALGKPPQGTNTVRTVYHSALTWQPYTDGDAIAVTYTIEANAFLYRMVRRTVGMLYDVALHRLMPDDFARLLAAGTVAQGVTIAPPQGLVLTRVMYRDETP
jgi:tRNA pseudouridine38-40 synthase